MFCKEYPLTEAPQDSLVSWEDSRKKYSLHRHETRIKTRIPPYEDSETGELKEISECTCHWELSPNVFLKAKAWAPALTLEWEIIKWLREKLP